MSIITYWVEKSGENYIHKSKIFYLNEKRFNEKVNLLNTNIEFINKNIENIGKIRDNIYPKSCTTFRGEDIYCSVQFDSKGSQTYGNSYVIETKKILENSSEEKIILVSGSTSFDSNIYHKPVAIGLSLYKIFDIFLTEYHDKKNNKTRLISSSFKKNLKNFYYSKISLSEMSYLGINIEDRYIEPSLFNNLTETVPFSALDKHPSDQIIDTAKPVVLNVSFLKNSVLTPAVETASLLTVASLAGVFWLEPFSLTTVVSSASQIVLSSFKVVNAQSAVNVASAI
jgi:hypothetical protein